MVNRVPPTNGASQVAAAAGAPAAAAGPSVTLAGLLKGLYPEAKLSELIQKWEEELGNDPRAEGTASIKLWRPGAIVGRDAAILVAQKSSNARLGIKYVLAVAAQLEASMGFQAIETYTEGSAPSGPAASAGSAPAGRSARGGGGAGGRFPKAEPGVHKVLSVRIQQLGTDEFLLVKTPGGEAKTKLSFLEKQGMDFSQWDSKVDYDPAPGMEFVKVEQVGFIASFQSEG